MKKPASSAARCTASSGVPARTVIVLAASSISSIPIMRSSDSATQPSTGRAPPHRPVNPPCGTTGTPCSAHRRITVATSAVVAGRATASGRIGGSVLQSRSCRAGMSAPARIACGPSAASNGSTMVPCMAGLFLDGAGETRDVVFDEERVEHRDR